MKLRDLIPNTYIRVSLRDLYIPRIGLPIWLQQNRQTDPGNIYNSPIHECENWETEHYNSVLEITRLRRFIFGNTSIGTRNFYWILTDPSFAVHAFYTEPLNALAFSYLYMYSTRCTIPVQEINYFIFLMKIITGTATKRSITQRLRHKT